MTQVFGVDISYAQPGFDFASARREGVCFAILKCSEDTFADPQFEKHYQAAAAANLPVGAYHFLHALSEEDARAEARFCLQTIAGKEFAYPIFLDFEKTEYLSLPKSKNEAIITAFCSTLEAAGYWAGVYMNYSFYLCAVNGAKLANRFSLWLAAWGNKCPASCQMWQFGGNVNALRSNLVAGMVTDQNYCYKDYPSEIRKKHLNGFRKKSVEEVAAEVIRGDWGNGLTRIARLTSAGYDYAAVQAKVNELFR